MQITRRRPARRIDPAKAAATDAAKTAGHAKGRRTPEEARQEIIDVARAYISKNGFRGLTVDKLMQGTEIGRSAFYVYFASIPELAAVFVHEISAKIEAASASWYHDEGDPIARIRETSTRRRGVLGGQRPDDPRARGSLVAG